MSTQEYSLGEVAELFGMLDGLAEAKADLERQAKLPDGRYDVGAVMWLNWLKNNADMLGHLTLHMEPTWDEALRPLVDVGVEIAAWRTELDEVSI